LPKPLTPDDGYIRCGKSSNCTNIPDTADDPATWLTYDAPYNWPAHPTTDWGDPQLLQELSSLAQTWYATFRKPIVINDISLPYGGLLDVNIDWKRPHASHRQGISADILKIGIPAYIRPTGNSTDKKWAKVWKDYHLLDDVNLEYEDCAYKVNGICVPDYNHLDLVQ
jgi:hypothetical protein